MRKVVIYGAGGHARELLFQLAEAKTAVSALVEDFNSGRAAKGIPILNLEEALARYSDAIWYVAIGNPFARREISDKLKNLGIELGGFVSNRALVAPSAKISHSAQVFAGTIISDDCIIEDGVIVHFNCVVAHNVRIGAYSFIAPRVAIAGHVDIGHDAWLGVGASIKNGSWERPLSIGNQAIIGAAACVINDVPSNFVMIGVPARRLRKVE
ncbi:MAG: hypothetical protein EKK35_17950 [Bradyrhizobiaceae bacterium]|nr:MAG: hypothetical protein EKK35_17950 [Bradyrhizobiaceae bacterium]